MKISVLLWESVRVLSRVPILASENACSNFCSFRDMTYLSIFSKFFRKLNYQKFRKTLNTISVVRLCYGTPRSCAFRRKYDCSNPCSFRGNKFFIILSKSFKKMLKNSKFFKISILLLDSVRIFLGDCESCLWIVLLKFL